MEISKFITVDFLASFTGTLFVVELIVFVTKNLPIIKKIKTRIYTFVLVMIHLIIMGIITGTATATLVYSYTAFVNSLIITAMLCGGYDVIVNKVQLITNNIGIKEKDNNNDNDNAVV